MSTDLLFPSLVLSDTEKDLLLEIYSNPVVTKHLKILALNDTKELLSFTALGKNDSEVAKAVATVQGKLTVLSTLLSISLQSQPKE
jgi:hypothetical protein